MGFIAYIHGIYRTPYFIYIIYRLYVHIYKPSKIYCTYIQYSFI